MTYLTLLLFPTIMSWLLTKLANVSHDLMRQWEWNHFWLAVRHHPRKHRKKKKAGQPSKSKDQGQRKRLWTPTYFLPMALIIFKVVYQVKNSVRHLKAALTIKRLPKLATFGAATRLPYQVPRIRFDTNSFVIGVNTFASITLGNHPDQFEDLKMHNNTEVEGIKGDLDIKGLGTFKFHIEDDKGGVHFIKIPNSKYVPDLRVCLLLPYHWAQEAKDHHPVPKGTKMNTNDEALMLMWIQRRHRRIISYHPLTNTSSFRTAPASCTYHAFLPYLKPLKHSTTNGSTSSKCPANSILTSNTLPKRTSTPASSRNHLWPLREPQTTNS